MKSHYRLAVLIALLALAASAVLVAAHAELVASEPAPGAVLAQPPDEIRLTFSEPVTDQSEILLFADGFQAIEGVTAQLDAADPAVIFATLPVLEAGVYTVQWSSISDDGHEISGTFSFTVGDSASATTSAAAPESSSSSMFTWLIAGMGVAVVFGILFIWLRRPKA